MTRPREVIDCLIFTFLRWQQKEYLFEDEDFANGHARQDLWDDG